MAGQGEIDLLNGLIVACEDGAQAYRSALKEIDDRDLKQVFYDLAIAREHTAARLRNTVHELGGTPKESGSASGLALRVYADLKTALSTFEENAILEELDRSEERTVGRFRSALRTDLPADVKKIVRACQNDVLASRQEIDALRQEVAGKAS